MTELEMYDTKKFSVFKVKIHLLAFGTTLMYFSYFCER
jgi:hypothetical protein